MFIIFVAGEPQSYNGTYLTFGRTPYIFGTMNRAIDAANATIEYGIRTGYDWRICASGYEVYELVHKPVFVRGAGDKTGRPVVKLTTGA